MCPSAITGNAALKMLRDGGRYTVLHKHVCSFNGHKKAKDNMLKPHDRFGYKHRNKHIESSPVSLSWMSGLKIERGCSVVMGESCKNDRKVQSTSQLSANHITFTDTWVHPVITRLGLM